MTLTSINKELSFCEIEANLDECLRKAISQGFSLATEKDSSLSKD